MAHRLSLLPLSVVALGLVAGCSQTPGKQGYILDTALVDAIKPGVDNRASVQGTLGRPTFVGQFDENEWFYVSRDTRQLAFRLPRPSAQTVLRVRFDPAGNVSAVEKSGVERVVAISPISDETPTLGRNRSFFQELFGNIGQIGSVGQSGGTADNPDGN